MAIFCEGTRYTVEKHKLAVKYAQEKGLPVLKHHLVPRTKGFAVLAEHFKPGGNVLADNAIDPDMDFNLSLVL